MICACPVERLVGACDTAKGSVDEPFLCVVRWWMYAQENAATKLQQYTMPKKVSLGCSCAVEWQQAVVVSVYLMTRFSHVATVERNFGPWWRTPMTDCCNCPVGSNHVSISLPSASASPAPVAVGSDSHLCWSGRLRPRRPWLRPSSLCAFWGASNHSNRA